MPLPAPDVSPWTAIERFAVEDGQRLALLGTDGRRMTYGELVEAMGSLGGELRQHGVQAGATVALLQPEGMGRLLGLLGVARGWQCAPLNPALTLPELRSLLERLRPAVLLAGPDFGEALALAKGLGLRTALLAGGEITGWSGERGGNKAAGQGGGDVPAGTGVGSAGGVLLTTSGTTGPSRLVPLSQANLLASVRATETALALTDRDRVLLLVPLFHLQGVLSVLSQLAVGGSVVVPAGFQRAAFPEWLRTLAPTWYTCGPALHRVLCAAMRAARDQPQASYKPLARGSLRFVRSIGARLPRTVALEVLRVLRVPVLNGYGLTETGMVTSLPPELADGSTEGVGRAVGIEVRIVLEGGTAAMKPLPPGVEGEIAVRGSSVTAGYRDDPEANARSFRDGWFLTGDLGSRDESGLLYVTGRVKETIHRGGEKVHPAEVDEVLLEHPDVADAAAFGVEDRARGEMVACAFVTRPGTSLTAAELRRFAAVRLAGYKVPRRIFEVEAIPRSATGKAQRHRLGELCLGLGSGEDAALPVGAAGGERTR